MAGMAGTTSMARRVRTTRRLSLDRKTDLEGLLAGLGSQAVSCDFRYYLVGEGSAVILTGTGTFAAPTACFTRSAWWPCTLCASKTSTTWAVEVGATAAVEGFEPE